MYALSLEECQRRRGVLQEIRQDLDANFGPDLVCTCHTNALAALPDLLERLTFGDDLAVEPILDFYKHCIDAWAKDIYSGDPVYESQFKAEIAVRFIQSSRKLESRSLCYQLKLASLEIVEAQLLHIEDFHQGRLAVQEDAGALTGRRLPA